MSFLKQKIAERQQNFTSIRAAFHSESGAIDLASIMVGIIVIGLIGGVIAATVFAVIPWSQDNAAKQQLESIHTAENAYHGLSADPSVIADETKRNKFTDSTGLDTAPTKLLTQNANYCVIPTADGKDYNAYAKSASGKIWTATNSKKTATVLTGTPLGACSVLGSSTGGGTTTPPAGGAAAALNPSKGTYTDGNSTNYATTGANGQTLDIEIDAAGRILVASDTAETISVYNSATNNYTTLATLPRTDPTVMARIAGIEIDSAGNIIAVSSNGGALYKISPTGVVTIITANSGAQFAMDLAIAADGSYIVADYNSSSVWRITTGGVATKIITDTAAGAIPGVAVGPDGKIYYSALLTGEIKRANLDGTNVETVYTYPAIQVWKIQFDASGSLFVPGYNGNKISKLDVVAKTSTTVVASAGTPTSLAFDSTGKMYVVKYDSSIQVFN